MRKKTDNELKKFHEENIQKLDEKIKQNKKIPKDYKKKMNNNTIFNLIVLLVITIYLVCLNFSSLYLETTMYIKSLKIFSIALAVISVVYFELSYRKDNEKLFLYGAEVLALAIVTLFSVYGYYIYFHSFNIILTFITVFFVLYYFIKTLVVRHRMKKLYYTEQNDISEIVKK